MHEEPSKFSCALVTGATSGIGEALSFLLASKGINLILVGRDSAKLAHLHKALGAQIEVTTLAADLTDKRDRNKLIELIKKAIPDLVINNAGFGLYGEALSHSTQEQMAILEVNGNAALEISLEASRSLIAKGKNGVILNVSSSAAFHAFPYMAVYAAAKSFIVQFSLAFDSEVQSKGIRVLTACPGMVATQFSARAAKAQSMKPIGFAMTPQYAAEQIWWQIQKRKPCYIFDWRYRWGTYLSRLLPKKWISAILRSNIASRLNKKSDCSGRA